MDTPTPPATAEPPEQAPEPTEGEARELRRAVWADCTRAILLERSGDDETMLGVVAATESRISRALATARAQGVEATLQRVDDVLGGAYRARVEEATRTDERRRRLAIDLLDAVAYDHANAPENIEASVGAITRALDEVAARERDRLAYRWGAIPGICRQCHGPCEEARGCYAVPTCYKCLPPPPPLETFSESARDRVIRGPVDAQRMTVVDELRSMSARTLRGLSETLDRLADELDRAAWQQKGLK